MARERLDRLVHQRRLAETREQARRLILAGKVRVNGLIIDKAGAGIDPEAQIEVEAGPPYVSRGGLKLEKALRVFDIDVQGVVAADVGASTGGFTDCLLQNGVERVYAIDVGRGQLDWGLRQDPRVVVLERTNARSLESLPEVVDVVTIDVSFISLRLILPAVCGWLAPGGQVIALIKPQFEAGRAQVGKGGVVRDTSTHRSVLLGLLEWATGQGWGFWGLARSPIKGPAGNIEFLAHLKRMGSLPNVPLAETVEAVLASESGLYVRGREAPL